MGIGVQILFRVRGADSFLGFGVGDVLRVLGSILFEGSVFVIISGFGVRSNFRVLGSCCFQDSGFVIL